LYFGVTDLRWVPPALCQAKPNQLIDPRHEPVEQIGHRFTHAGLHESFQLGDVDRRFGFWWPRPAVVCSALADVPLNSIAPGMYLTINSPLSWAGRWARQEKAKAAVGDSQPSNFAGKV
jgi:hypothetical protein